MTVAQLIEELQKMPQYAPVFAYPPDKTYFSGEEVEAATWHGSFVLLQT